MSIFNRNTTIFYFNKYLEQSNHLYFWLNLIVIDKLTEITAGKAEPLTISRRESGEQKMPKKTPYKLISN